MDIVVNFRSVYGKEFFYPVSEDAQFITELTGRPTILARQLELLRKKGHKIKVINEAMQKFNQGFNERIQPKMATE